MATQTSSQSPIETALNEAMTRLVGLQIILNGSPTPSYQERSAMMRDALERKKVAVTLLASAQSDIETQASYMIEERGLDETIRFQDAHYNIGDTYTAIGKFIIAATRLTIASPSSDSESI